MNPGLRGGGQWWDVLWDWVAPALSPTPECLAAQSNGVEHPQVQKEPPCCHPAIHLQDKSPGSPWSFPMSHMCSLPRAQSTGRGHAQRRGLSSHIFIPASPGHRHHRHQRAAREGDAPSCSASHTRGKLLSPSSFLGCHNHNTNCSEISASFEELGTRSLITPAFISHVRS